MKNTYIALVLFCIIFTSCKKDNKQINRSDNKLHNVTFTVNDFSQQHLPFQTNNVKSKSTNSFRVNSITNDTINTPTLYYLVYDTSGRNVQNIKQRADTSSNFGTIASKLHSGTYTVILVGGYVSTYANSTNIKNMNVGVGTLSGSMMGYSDNSKLPVPFNETFYKKFTINVTNANIAQNISLPHIVAQLIVKIKDAIPANVGTISYVFDSQYTYFNLNTGLPVDNDSGLALGRSASAFTTGETNYTISQYTINTTKPFFVTITAYGSSGIIASKTIQNVRCTANQQVILSGNLFGGTTTGAIGSGTKITSDTLWNATTLNYNF